MHGGGRGVDGLAGVDEDDGTAGSTQDHRGPRPAGPPPTTSTSGAAEKGGHGPHRAAAGLRCKHGVTECHRWTTRPAPACGGCARPAASAFASSRSAAPTRRRRSAATSWAAAPSRSRRAAAWQPPWTSPRPSCSGWRRRRRGWSRRPVVLRNGGRATRLSRLGPGGHMRIVRLDLPARERLAPPGVHAGYEWLFVLGGEVELQVDERIERLMEGEAAEFDTGRPHAMRAAGGKPRHRADRAGRVGRGRAPAVSRLRPARGRTRAATSGSTISSSSYERCESSASVRKSMAAWIGSKSSGWLMWCTSAWSTAWMASWITRCSSVEAVDDGAEAGVAAPQVREDRVVLQPVVLGRRRRSSARRTRRASSRSAAAPSR